MPSRRAWWITGGAVAVVAAGAIGGPLVYAALEEDAPPAQTVQVQPEDVELTAETDGTWTVAGGSSAGYRVHEVLNGADVTVAGTTDQVTGTPVTVPVTGELTLHGVTRTVQTEISVVRTAEGVDVSGSVPVAFGDYGVQAPSLGFVRVDDQGAVEFFLHLTQ